MPRKSNQLAKRRLDKFYHLAKAEGYKSRAAFKLIQINREYNFLSSCNCLIDLCSSPGGWTQVAAKLMPLSSQIISVDICKMKAIVGTVFIQGDITTQKCKFQIKKHLHGRLADVVIHDGSPNITGKWSKDAYAQCELTLHALKLVTGFLKCGGTFITKVFRSADYNALLWAIQQLFENVTSYKPIASRQSSAEIYFICKNYLAPKKIDPRLLNSEFLFREIVAQPESLSVMRMRKQKNAKPSRIGYEQNDGLLVKTTNVKEFLQSISPETILGDFHSFTFDIQDNLISSHSLTTEEIHHLLSDLQVLNKSDFRRLLRWRNKMNKYLFSRNESKDEPLKEKEYTNEEMELKEDQELEADVREMFNKKKRERKKISRKIRQAKIKRTRLMLMGGVKPDDIWNIGENEQQGLFQLSNFEDTEQLSNFMNAGHSIIIPDVGRRMKPKKITTFVDVFEDSDEELEVEEERLDDLYLRYKKRAGIRSIKEERKLIRDGTHLGKDDEFSSESALDSSENENKEEEKNIDVQIEEKQKLLNVSEHDLLIKTSDFIIKEDTKEMKANRWFSSGIFDDIEIDEELDNKLIIEEFGELIDKDSKKMEEKEEQFGMELDIGKEMESENMKKSMGKTKFKYKDLPDILKVPYKIRRKIKKMNRDHRRRLKRDEEKRQERDCLFYEVPMELNEDSTDSEAIAECLAIGEKMVTNKKARMNIINDSYNRWSFNNMDEDSDDGHGSQLPQWFIDDERANYCKNLPVTKAEVQEYKQRLKAINARPIKKIAEAKARKKLRAQRVWNKMKRKATAIADSTEISERSKMKQIEKLYAKMGKKKKVNKSLMISTRGRKPRPVTGKRPGRGSVKVYVDSRLKADKLGAKHAGKRRMAGKIKKSVKRHRNSKNLRKGRNRHYK